MATTKQSIDPRKVLAVGSVILSAGYLGLRIARLINGKKSKKEEQAKEKLKAITQFVAAKEKLTEEQLENLKKTVERQEVTINMLSGELLRHDREQVNLKNGVAIATQKANEAFTRAESVYLNANYNNGNNFPLRR